MKIRLINNYYYKGHWSNLLHFVYTKDCLSDNLLMGLLGIFVFVTW
jgi:hypothetical protein